MAKLKLISKIAVMIVPAVAWVGFAFFMAFEGMWMTPVSVPNDSQAFVQFAKQTMDEKLKGNGALILVEQGKIAQRYFKTVSTAGDDISFEVTENTLFPAASMSKLVAAVAIHTLAEQGHISLNDSIEKHVSSWQLPDSAYDHEQVTIARLLSHTAGLTDGLGFGDYTAHETLPSITESLAQPRSASGDKQIVVGQTPGTAFKYSGGSYLLLELLVEEVTGDSYESWVSKNVLRPRGMIRTNFNYIEKSDDYSLSYDINGQLSPSFQYASSAATAMNTTAADLVALIQSLLTQPSMIEQLSQPMGMAMGAPIWGPGAMLYVPLNEGRYVIGHDGSNDPAINTSVRINPETGDGFIALVSGHTSLASEIGYEWVLWQSGKPDFVFTDRAIASAVTPMAIGAIGWLVFCLLAFWLRGKKR